MKVKLFFICLSLCIPAFAQNGYRATGLLPIDSTFYNQLPLKNDNRRGLSKALPSRHSLKDFCPEVKDQGKFATCGAWASAYAARTIAEAVQYGWRDTQYITVEAFSPLFVYALAKCKDDVDCSEGILLHKALEVMREKGVPKYSSFPDEQRCADVAEITDHMMSEAAHFRIDDAPALFRTGDSGIDKIKNVKKSLSDDCPVVIGMYIPKDPESSFKATHDETWSGKDRYAESINYGKTHGYHAMCVIGYDDNKEGGAFQIMNSWGPDWGNGGFIWVTYEHFCKYVFEAYEVYVEKLEDPEPYPLPKTIRNFASEVDFRERQSGEKIMPELKSVQDMKCYKMAGSYSSDTVFDMDITNDESPYVYVIASDLENNVAILTPRKLSHGIKMDSTKGTDYLCILFSKYELHIRRVVEDIKEKEGSFYEKLQYAMSGRLALKKEVEYSPDKLGFRATTKKTVVPLIIEIEHR
ncbi:MAG: C1 family peptidase [Bacteroidales bacterium]|nr:C1 family peptidase [Bacteroidales bacterium]